MNNLIVNNYVKIEFENENPLERKISGIIFDVKIDFILILTEYGEIVKIEKDKILSVEKTEFNPIVKNQLKEIHGFYSELSKMRNNILRLESKTQLYKERLYDANFLANFNIYGAKNRIENSVPNSLFEFSKNNLLFKISIEIRDEQLELSFKVFNSFEYYNLKETSDIEKIIRVHAPNVKDSIIFRNKNFLEILEVEKKVIHEQGNIYSVLTHYKVPINITVENFIEIRNEIIESLKMLKNN